MSTTSVAWTTAGRSDSVPTVLSPGAFGSDHEGEPCSPLPGEAGSLVSLSSSTVAGGGRAVRVTSDATSAVGIGIAANADDAAITIAATTPGREGLAAATLFPSLLAATCYRVGLHASCTGVGAMLNPIIARPLTEGVGKSHSKKIQQHKIEKKQRKNVPGGERYDSKGKTQRR